MKQIKAGKPLQEFVNLCYQANQPLLLVGRHGVGKSELLEQAAAALGIEYICRDLSLMEPPDLVGMPKLEGGVTRYLPPAFLPTKGKGLLVFEELNRCPAYMRAPCLQLLTARMLNDYKLPEGWLPVAAINPEDSGYDVNELDPAILSRFVKVQVVPDRKEWLAWAQAKGVQEAVCGYVESDAKIFTDTSPRDWYMASRLIETASSLKTDVDGANILAAALAGVVGRERAMAFTAYLKGENPLPEISEVIKNYGRYLKQLLNWKKMGQLDKLENLCHSLKVYLQVEDNYNKLFRNKNYWHNFFCFLRDLPPDLSDDVKIFLAKHHYDIPDQ